MKITKQHKDFYISKKLPLNPLVWGLSEEVSVHKLINSQTHLERHTLANTAKQSFYRRVAKTNKDKATLVYKYYLQSLTERDYEHLTQFYATFINSLRGFMLYKHRTTGKVYKVENNRVFVDLDCGWFKSDYKISEIKKLIKDGTLSLKV